MLAAFPPTFRRSIKARTRHPVQVPHIHGTIRQSSWDVSSIMFRGGWPAAAYSGLTATREHRAMQSFDIPYWRRVGRRGSGDSRGPQHRQASANGKTGPPNTRDAGAGPMAGRIYHAPQIVAAIQGRIQRKRPKSSTRSGQPAVRVSAGWISALKRADGHGRSTTDRVSPRKQSDTSPAQCQNAKSCPN